MFKLNVISEHKNTVIEYDASHNNCLSDILRNNNILINTACGGHGICKKCLVTISDTHGTKDVLACKYIPDSDLSVYIVSEPSKDSLEKSSYYTSDKPTVFSKIYAAADIGSTGITICLCNDSSVIASTSFTNPTTAYGADVMSRISASLSGHGSEMSVTLRKSIYTHIMLLLEKYHISTDKLCRIVLSANNVMQHILLNLNTSSIASYPFTSKYTSFGISSFRQIFDKKTIPDGTDCDCHADIYIIPSFSAFIGGDIISGLYSKDIHASSDTFLFIDLGTNAEMVIGNSSHMLCTSAAAGPAFEASGLSCGCAYIPGAIYDLNIKRSYISYKTVNDIIPTGICGSGALLLLSELIKSGFVDSYGTLCENYIDCGFPVTKSPGHIIKITQADIRNIQLAIAAIKAGIDILLREYNVTANDIKHVYVSGSFGSSLDFDRLTNLNIFPKEWITSDIISVLGNTSLSGAVKYAHEISDKTPDFRNITCHMDELILAEHPLFNETYLSAINFTQL